MAKSYSLKSILLEGMRKYVLILVLVFGSLLTFLDYSYKLLEYAEARLLIIPLLFVLGYFIYLSIDLERRYSRAEKSKLELSARELEALEKLEKRIAELYGFKNALVKIERDISLDGSADGLSSFEVVATRDGFSSRVHYHQAGVGTKFEQLSHDFKITKSSSKHSVTPHALNGSPSRFLLDVRFSPPLDKDDSVAYEIHEKYTGAFLMTKEGILDKIATGHWIIAEPYESTMFLVIYPTDKLIMEVTFPYGYRIEGKEWFDVTVGESSYRSEPEYRRLLDEKALDVEETEQNGQKRYTVTLAVNKPTIGMCYWIKWIPPSASEYMKLAQGK